MGWCPLAITMRPRMSRSVCMSSTIKMFCTSSSAFSSVRVTGDDGFHRLTGVWLGDLVVGFARSAALRGHQDHRNARGPRIALQRLADLVTVLVRHHDIQEDQ